MSLISSRLLAGPVSVANVKPFFITRSIVAFIFLQFDKLATSSSSHGESPGFTSSVCVWTRPHLLTRPSSSLSHMTVPAS